MHVSVTLSCIQTYKTYSSDFRSSSISSSFWFDMKNSCWFTYIWTQDAPPLNSKRTLARCFKKQLSDCFVLCNWFEWITYPHYTSITFSIRSVKVFKHLLFKTLAELFNANPCLFTIIQLAKSCGMSFSFPHFPTCTSVLTSLATAFKRRQITAACFATMWVGFQ